MVLFFIFFTFTFIFLSYFIFRNYDKRYRSGRVIRRNQAQPVHIVYTVPALQQNYPATPEIATPMQQKFSDAPPSYDQVVLTPTRLQETTT